jgi:hypothetical protein
VALMAVLSPPAKSPAGAVPKQAAAGLDGPASPDVLKNASAGSTRTPKAATATLAATAAACRLPGLGRESDQFRRGLMPDDGFVWNLRHKGTTPVRDRPAG